MAILGIDFLRVHCLYMDSAKCSHSWWTHLPNNLCSVLGTAGPASVKEAISLLCSLCVTSNNEQIVIRQARDVPMTYNGVNTVMSC